MERRSRSSNRRSYPNLHSLSLAPLKTLPLDASSPPSPSDQGATTPHTSYIQLKSAPTTPGILSLSQSRSNSRNGRRRSQGRNTYAHEGYFPSSEAEPWRDAGDIPKAKSTNALLPNVSFAEEVDKQRHHTRAGTTHKNLRIPVVRHHTSETNDEWLVRAGLAIAGETRESKGQSWLVSRESSTSLVLQGENEERGAHEGRMTLMSGALADDEFSPITPRRSRIGSRAGSRVASARGSRRGSRVGSRIDLAMSAGAKGGSARHSLELEESMFENQPLEEPDFVDNEESDGDEEEIARLARERGFGLGSWMDRLIGWTLFSVEEDGEESSDEEENDTDRPENMTKEERRLRAEVEAKRKKLEREAIIAASAAKTPARTPKDPSQEGESSEAPNEQTGPNEDGGGWQDAAWLLSVASKVIL